ncbi:MAG: glycine cleavage system protein GcvH [Actinomycetia bacterium]|jgi:glycine cleavage system H protein|nr:glycine cleavage system protein GcvH [Actinomycetes bacterium]MCH9841135.1 glycine cleavage system protein GcvH [Actinomycetes bacterium]
MTPDELSYTSDHEWVRLNESGNAVFGITFYAQDSLGDIVYVSLPAVGDELIAGTSCGEVESTKSVSDLFAPIDGTVISVNSELEANPELVNSSPYSQGWLVEVEPDIPQQIDELLSSIDYNALINQA